MTETMNKRRAIILDLDDCVFDFIGHLCLLHNKKYNTHITRSHITRFDLDVEERDIYGVVLKNATLEKTFKELEPYGLYAVLPVFYEAKQAFKIFKDLGYAIIFLTARSEKFRKQTEIAIWLNDIIPDKLVFNKNKVNAINSLSEKYEIVMFADDKPQTVKSVNTNCKVKYPILITRTYNEKAKLSQNIYRCNDLLETIKFLIKKEE